MKNERSMTHEETLNLILSNACPIEVVDNNVYIFHLVAHCKSFDVIAERIANGKYKVLSCMPG